MISGAVAALHKRFPDLTGHGLCHPTDVCTGEWTTADLIAEAERFPDQVKTCVKWLKKCLVLDGYRAEQDTYTYKHEVETWADEWIAHLSMLVAVQIVGLDMEVNPAREWAGLLKLGRIRPGALR